MPSVRRFEDGASYVSLLPMSSQAGSRETNGGLTSVRTTVAVFESATEAPTIERETREQEAFDLPWQVVVGMTVLSLFVLLLTFRTELMRGEAESDAVQQRLVIQDPAHAQ